MREEDYERLLAVARAREARLLVITLAPPVEVALGDRGNRKLDDAERARISEMYAEGYHQRAFSDLIIAGATSVELAVQQILAWLNDPTAKP